MLSQPAGRQGTKHLAGILLLQKELNVQSFFYIPQLKKDIRLTCMYGR